MPHRGLKLADPSGFSVIFTDLKIRTHAQYMHSACLN